MCLSIVQFGNHEEYRALLEDALRGNRVRQNVVAAKVVNAFWPAELAEAIKQRDTQARPSPLSYLLTCGVTPTSYVHFHYAAVGRFP
jgi:hypothetical protein